MAHPQAGTHAPADGLVDVGRLEREFFARAPDPRDPAQRVSFGTSGHRGTPLDGSFNAAHIAAITQAICDYRAAQGITGPIYVGKDTHAVSRPAEAIAVGVLAANQARAIVQAGDGFTPTPVISRAIVRWNADRSAPRADGIVITPSHNPPEDGGIKYNPPHGGPADASVTRWIEDRANELLGAPGGVRRVDDGLRAPTTRQDDLLAPYVDELAQVIDLDAIRNAGVRMGVDPMGGASAAGWALIAARHGLDLTVVNATIDPTFGFMPLDHDGRIRMDCSSPYAMADLVALKDRFDVAFGNDPDADRHGIVTPSSGLMSPNDYLAVSIGYLLAHRPAWPPQAAIGKTIVSSSLIDRVVERAGRRVIEVPVGFKWFAPLLSDGTIGFGGEESAGASFLQRDGAVWTTDKDGLILGLLAAEIVARTGKDPGLHAADLRAAFGAYDYVRIDAPASAEARARLRALSPDDVDAATLAGDPIRARLTTAPGNGEAIGGLKVVTDGGWFAARPSGTEDLYKIYAESVRGRAHLDDIVADAQQIVGHALAR